jgi:prefoldin subunit 5
MNRDQLLAHYLRHEREQITEALRIRGEDIAKLCARLSQIERQLQKYETER